MSILTLRNEIELICSILDLIYIRATEDQANIEIGQIDTFYPLAIHIDRTTILGTPAEFGNYVYKEIPTEILFLMKNPNMDEYLKDVDTIVDNMEKVADSFYDKLIQSSVMDSLAPLPGYETERLAGYKRFDTVMSGVQFNMDVPISRTQYYCK